MSVTASFEPDRVEAAAGESTSLALHIKNDSDVESMVTLRVSGALAAQTVLQTETIYLDPNEHFEVAVIVDTNSTLLAGAHDCVIDVVNGSETSTARATVDINATEAWNTRLEPPRSMSAFVGRHKIAVENSGNVPIAAALSAFSASGVTTELAAPIVNVDPGQTAKVELKLTPASRFWRGPTFEHPFTVDVTRDQGEQVQLDGIFEQGPRVRSWFVPALAGVVGSLLIGTLAWFTLLKPSIERTAQREATELDLAQQAILDRQLAEIDAASKEASELPLGQPTDLRLTVTSGPATSAVKTFDFDKSGTGRILSISDIIFQNPTGAVGRVELLRDDTVLLDQEMANFRDLDFHLVAPFRIDSGSSISLRVECETPGPGTDACEVAATVVGFVDDV